MRLSRFLTWISTAEVISLLGAKPVFVDIRPDTWNMDETLLESAITDKTIAIIPVSIYGQCPDGCHQRDCKEIQLTCNRRCS